MRGDAVESSIFQVPATITKIETMANGLKLRVDTQENLSPEAMKRLMELHNQLGWFTFNINQIDAQDIVDLPPLKKTEKDEKTPSQRLRAVFYLMWKQVNWGHQTAEDYYKEMMENLITHYKEKLDD